MQALLLSAGSVHVETIVVNGLLLLPFWAYPPQLLVTSKRSEGPTARKEGGVTKWTLAQRAIQLP